MKIEFLAVCDIAFSKEDLHLVASDSLATALNEHYAIYDYDWLVLSTPEPSEMITVFLEREVRDESGNVTRKIYGFTVSFDIETESLTAREFQDTIFYLEQINQRLSDLLQDFDSIKNLVKFFDDVLLATNLAKMREVYEIEMKLRQVISLIYLSAFNDEEFYKLLRFDKIKAQGSLPTDESIMKAICENEFFHLTFGQYPKLNNKKDLSSHKELIELVIEVSNFDELKFKLLNNPIRDENDTDLISFLRDTSPKIEEFRNCVAHNRKLSEPLLNNYTEARELLTERLKKYLEQFSLSNMDLESADSV